MSPRCRRQLHGDVAVPAPCPRWHLRALQLVGWRSGGVGAPLTFLQPSPSSSSRTKGQEDLAKILGVCANCQGRGAAVPTNPGAAACVYFFLWGGGSWPQSAQGGRVLKSAGEAHFWPGLSSACWHGACGHRHSPSDVTSPPSLPRRHSGSGAGGAGTHGETPWPPGTPGDRAHLQLSQSPGCFLWVLGRVWGHQR